MPAKKRNNNKKTTDASHDDEASHSQPELVTPVEEEAEAEVEVPAVEEKAVESNPHTDDAAAPAATEAVAAVAEAAAAAVVAAASPASPTSLSSEVVEKAKAVANSAVEQVKAQLGPEKTALAMDYAAKAKAEVLEAVDFAKGAVDEGVGKAKARADETYQNAKGRVDNVTVKVAEAKEQIVAKVGEAKAKADETLQCAKGRVDVAKAKVTDSLEGLKTTPRRRAAEAAAWLKGDVAETPLEHTAVDVATYVIATSLNAGSAALGLVGLDAKAANAVSAARTKISTAAAHAPLVQSVHSFASEYWVYRLAARMTATVDHNVRDRIAGGATAASTAAAPSTDSAPVAATN